MIYGGVCYRPGSVLMHQMRASPPSIAGPAMDRATQLQLHLLRSITGASKEMLGGAMEEWLGTASERACACRCSLSAHLQSVFSGCNWPEPRLVQPFVHLGKVVDTYPTICSMADMGWYPHPSAWATCSVGTTTKLSATTRLLTRLSSTR